jgi:hypothetical protein
MQLMEQRTLRYNIQQNKWNLIKLTHEPHQLLG